jgi:hypothetical protein
VIQSLHCNARNIQTDTEDAKILIHELLKDKESLEVLAKSLAEILGVRLVPVEKD